MFFAFVIQKVLQLLLFLRLRVTQKALQLTFFFPSSFSLSRQFLWADCNKFLEDVFKLE